ncbi:LacI family transcriptional regulator [Streptomyces sp. NBC_00006]|uniref:LacI family DNA-binding transcriptional regulator n=1 Tax=Streptomyces sp. NBC_00006 TaxID=2975619 RepID=UPI0022531D83|nr:LacI family DNA-binding transcriptional regulator [Streptomyces sp. NBC_00006]MCX5535234.1 LacI family transcriptional regulator [Streptomyces sp. NBC_00006]
MAVPAGNDLPHLDRSGRPTLATVATLAGVHPSTASRALSSSLPSGVRVGSNGTIERIRKIAEEVGFARNMHAAGLRTKRTFLAGVLVPRLTDMVLAMVYEGIDEEARRRGYQTVVANTHDDDAERAAKLDVLLARQVDGVVLGDARFEHDALIDQLRARNVPFVLVSRRSADCPSVTCDDYAGGRLAAQHLIELGHRRVAVVAGEPYASTARDRVQGFVDAFRDIGQPPPPDLVVASAFDVAGGRRACRQILDAPGPAPTAIFAVNDFAAIGTLGVLRAEGVTVGRDIAVIGYNDIPLAGDLPLPLSSIRSPLHDMGTGAMELLLAGLDGKEMTSRTLQPSLEARESTLGLDGPPQSRRP